MRGVRRLAGARAADAPARAPRGRLGRVRPSRRLAARLILFALAALVVAAATPTLGALTATITASGHSTAASMVMTSTPSGSSTCTSTGGTNTPFASDSATCTSFPAGSLTAGAESSVPITLATVGTVAPSSASVDTGGTGLQVAPDASGDGDDAFPVGGVSFYASGPLSASAAALDGSSGVLETQQLINDPGPNLTLSGWFKVASGYANGGGIIGFQSSQTGTPASGWDRRVWMDDSGHIDAGEDTGGTNEIATSPGAYNNGAWHYFVASFSSSSGLNLYIDGSSVATNSSATAASSFTGYWVIGYLAGTNWSPAPASEYLAGSLAEIAVFASSLSAGQVTTLYNGGSGSESSFETRVLADAPGEFWPLQSPSATTNLPDIATLPDVSGNNNLATPQGGVSPSDDGPFSGDGAMYFDGATGGSSWAQTTTANSALASSFTIAAWFRAPSGLSTGGGILTLDSSQSGGGAHHDPLLWMDNSGKIVAGTYTSADRAATSPSAYNDGHWHFAVATVGSAGLNLYIDGGLVATNSSGTSGGSQGGYWLIGQGDQASWSDPPTSEYWTGELAHAAYFASALSAGQISTLYGEASVGNFETQMLADSPTYYWPLTDSGTSASEGFPFYQVEPDVSGAGDDATAVGSTVTLGVPGPVTSAYAAAFSGSTGYLETASSISSPPDTFSIVAWFRAPSQSTGGGIIGYDSAQSGGGLTHDRMLWMDDSGKIVAGISGGNGVEATSTSTYDDGAWHLAVAVFTPSTLTLYVDGSQVASATSGISDNNYSGYWTVGFNHESGTWADQATNQEWTGSLADVAVIPSALSSGTVSTIYGEASQSALATELLSLAPTQYWPLSSLASAPSDSGGVELTIQSTNSTTTTCAFPAGAGSCPATAASDYTPSQTTVAVIAPTAAHSTSVSFGVEMPTAPPAPFANLHFVIPISLAGAEGSAWAASLTYPGANFEY
jgi:hypothetical protein